MKNQQILVRIIVILALVGFLVCAGYLFYNAFNVDNGNELNSSLLYITTGLTGLVGGIVATGFGVKKPNPPSGGEPGVAAEPAPLKVSHSAKFQNLGGFASSSKDSDKSKERMGFYYALAYLLVGVTAIVIWVIKQDQTIETVSNMATTFFGMMVPIVAQFFRGN